MLSQDWFTFPIILFNHLPTCYTFVVVVFAFFSPIWISSTKPSLLATPKRKWASYPRNSTLPISYSVDNMLPSTRYCVLCLALYEVETLCNEERLVLMSSSGTHPRYYKKIMIYLAKLNQASLPHRWTESMWSVHFYPWGTASKAKFLFPMQLPKKQMGYVFLPAPYYLFYFFHNWRPSRKSLHNSEGMCSLFQFSQPNRLNSIHLVMFVQS